MKITTWNVNGYRAVLKKGFKDWFNANGSDIVCLQEVKSRPDQIAEDDWKFSGYDTWWNPATKLGYSGVATFANRAPLELGYGVGDEEFDVEGRVIWLQYQDFRLYNVYFPSGQRGMGRVEYKLRFYSRLLTIVDELMANGMNVIICGDFNTAHNEIDLANPKSNQNTSGFLQIEREMVSEYLRHHLVDVYRQLYPEKVEYTWWTYITQARERNVGWRLDYFMVSEGLVERIQKVEIQTSVPGSDHCPVSLIFE
jgi:exodeoxyribonuclease-3